MIDKNSPIPIYYQLKQIIKQQIEEQVLPPGEKLPTEQMLCERYDVSRAPVRQALLELVQEGYIYRRAGMGTFVSERSTEAAATTTLRLLAYDVRWITLIQQAVHRWNRLHPGRKVLLDVNMPPQSDFHRLLCAEVGEGNAHDLISIDYVWVTRYARMGFLVPIDVLDPEFATWMKSEIETPVLNSNVLDGHLYGLPVQADVTGLWYRRDWFEAEGLQPPQTWAEWRTLLDYLARDEVKARWGYEHPIALPISMDAGEATFNVLLALIWGAGGDIEAQDGFVYLDNPGLKQTLSFLRDLTQQGKYLSPQSGILHWWGPPGLLAGGKVPMTLGGTYEWPTIAETAGWEGEEELLEHLGFVPLPRPDASTPPVASLGGTTLVFPRQSENLALTLEIMRLALGPEVAVPFFVHELQISPFRSINRQLMEDNHPWLQTIVPLLALARSRPQLTEYIQFSRFLQLMFEEVLYEGVPVEIAVRQASKTLQILLSPF